MCTPVGTQEYMGVLKGLRRDSLPRSSRAVLAEEHECREGTLEGHAERPETPWIRERRLALRCRTEGERHDANVQGREGGKEKGTMSPRTQGRQY
jgi:hypothetical protein